MRRVQENSYIWRRPLSDFDRVVQDHKKKKSENNDQYSVSSRRRRRWPSSTAAKGRTSNTCPMRSATDRSRPCTFAASPACRACWSPIPSASLCSMNSPVSASTGTSGTASDSVAIVTRARAACSFGRIDRSGQIFEHGPARFVQVGELGRSRWQLSSKSTSPDGAYKRGVSPACCRLLPACRDRRGSGDRSQDKRILLICASWMLFSICWRPSG